MQTPTCTGITTILLVVVIGGMTAGGYGLFACRADRPAAAVNAAGFGNGFDLNGRAVHFFLRFQLDLIRADSIGKIKTSAGGLGRCLPAGVVFLHNRFRLRFLLTDLRSDQGNGLPTCAAGVVDIGVVTAGGGVGFHAVQKLIGRGKINFRGGAFGEALDNIHLHIVINRLTEIQKRGFFTLISGKNSGQIVRIAQRKLVQAAPDANLVAVVVTRDALVCVDRGSVHIGVCRASCRLTVGTVGAAVGGFAVEPDQPSAVDLGNLGDLAACHRRGGALGKGGNFAVRERILGSRIAVDGHLQGFGQAAAVRGGINQLCGKIRICLHIYTQHSSGGFAVFAMQQTFGILGGLAVVVQQSHAVRQNQINGAAVGGVLHLRQNRHNGVVGIFQQGRCQRQVVAVQRLGAQITILL